MLSIANILNLILIVGVIQGFIFNIVIFFTNKFKDKTILFLSLTVLFLSINNLQSWLIDRNLEFSFYYIKHLKIPWNIFLAPMFYLFLINYLRIEKHIKNFLFPSVFLLISCTLLRIILLNYLIPQIGTSQFKFILRRYNSIEDIIIFVFTISIFSYCGVVFFKKKKRFELMSSYDNLKWIKTFFILSSIVLLFWLIALFLNYHFTSVNTSYFYSPLRLGTSFLIYWIGYQGLYQQKFVNDRIGIRYRLNIQPSLKNDILTVKTNINSKANKHQILFERINDSIITKKKFTNPALSLESLASEFKISTSFLSQLINKYSNKHFTDFINNYRIELVKELLLNENYNQYTILAIGLESGFNSKSTFYTAFKKHVSLTPAQYKKVYHNRVN